MASLLREINKYRRKLYEVIEVDGLDADEVKEISPILDKLINEFMEKENKLDYPPKNEMLEYYLDAYEHLLRITKDFGFPNPLEWNRYAKFYGYLSSESLKYISKKNWRKLRTKVEMELEFNFLKKIFP